MFGLRAVIAAWVFALAVCGFGVQPTRFNYQAQLTDAGGSPLMGSHSCVFRIYEGGTLNGANSGALKYEEGASLNVSEGMVTHAIGTGVPNGPSLKAGVFATSSDLFLQVAVDGNTLLPRTRLESVPFAINAAYAANGELRIAIDPSAPGFTTPFTISQPGSYYLAGNINVSESHAVVITTSCVTLDLNGFTLSSTSLPNGGVGVVLGSAISNTTIRNGKISGGVVNVGGNSYAGPGFYYGILSTGSAPSQVRVSDLSINGVFQDAITLGGLYDVVVERCTVQSVGGFAISATDVNFCQVRDIGGAGIKALNGVNNCTVRSTGDAIVGGVASNCTAFSQEGVGISVTTAMNCFGNTNGNANGVGATNATNCYGYSANGIGLYAEMSATNCTGISGANHGLEADHNASNCYGQTGGTGKYGLYVMGTANTCGGKNSSGVSEIAIKATVGIGCTTYGGITDIPAGGKFLGTP